MPGVFSRHAVAYRDRLAAAAARGEARGRARVVELLAVRPGWRVLDLGCGPGVLTVPLAAAVGPGGLVVGADLAEGMLALARSVAPAQVGLARMDMERLAVRDGAFDAVACGHSLQFCPDLGAALAEVRRALRAGGRFAACLPAPEPPGPAATLLEEVFARRLAPMPQPADARATRETVGDPDRLAAALTAAGLRGAVVERVSERSRYDGPAGLVDHTLAWWSCAWRLESAAPAVRAEVREEALTLLRAELGDGPIEMTLATLVATAER